MNEFKKSNRIQRTAIAIAITSALSSAAVMAAEEAAVDTSDVEVIEVRGIAGSLAESARKKRFSNKIVDAIVADDIGKLPDHNIAEALSRITGVSIKSDFGVGDSITIRGISDNLVLLNGRSTAGSGRGGIGLSDFPSSFLKTIEVSKSPTPEMMEGALGGTISMETIRPLELKDTHIAGSVDYEYADHTENWAPIVSGAVGSNWDLGGAGRFGASVVYSYQDRTLRRDESFNKVSLYRDVDINNDGVYNDTGNGPDGQFVVRHENTVEPKTEDRERTAYGVSLQWEPTSAAGNIYLDLNGTELDGGQTSYSILDLGAYSSSSVLTTDDTWQDGNGQVNDYSYEARLIPKSESDFSENNTYSNALGADWQLTEKLSISGEISNARSAETIQNAQINLRGIDKDAYLTARADDPSVSPGSYEWKQNLDINHSGEKVPGLDYNEGVVSDEGIPTNNFVIREMYYDKTYIENEQTAARIDFTYTEPMGIEWISAVKVGVRATDVEYTKNKKELGRSAGNSFKDAYKKADWDATDGKDYRPTFVDDFVTMYPDTFTNAKQDNSFDQTDFAGPNGLAGDFALYNPYLLKNDLEGSWEKFQGLWDGSSYATTGTLEENTYSNDGEYSNIEEDTLALYVQWELDFDDITAVVGARYVETDIDSTTVLDEKYIPKEGDTPEEIAQKAADLAVLLESAPGLSADLENATLTGSNDYDDFLPSLNVTYHYDDETLVRFAAAKVMRRQSYDDLSSATVADASYVNASQGSHTLDPQRITQYDLSVEHYFGEGGVVSAAVFYKDVEDIPLEISTCVADPGTVGNQNVTQFESVCLLDERGVDNQDIEYVSADDDFGGDEDAALAAVQLQSNLGLTGVNTSSKVNGGGGDVSGFELAYQQQFHFLPGAWSGLGMSTNYTYADSEQDDGNLMENISRHTANAQVYWESDAFQIRFAYNWRDRYLDDQNVKRVEKIGALGLGTSNNSDPTADGFDVTAGNSYREARGQLDFSASYDIDENWTVVANVTNLTGEPIVYTTELETDWKYSESDSRYTFGVRAKF